MKKIKSIAVVFTAAFTLASCTEWLDLKPFDQILDDELYSTERGINSALNGLYLNLSDPYLYGKNLSYYSIELLSGRYHMKANMDGGQLEITDLPYYNYTENIAVRNHLDGIFTKAYNVIRDLNYYITMVQDSKVVAGDKKNLLLGEGYALRAFLHFDMLRFYGFPPVLDIHGKGIPYYNRMTNDWEKIKENGEVIALVLEDLDTALEYLKNDPVISIGVITDNSEYDFYNVYRNRRMNYFSTLALKARVLLYSGNATSIAAAGEIAKELIESESFHAAFPWKQSVGEFTYGDEVMFGVHVATMYEDWARWFNTSSSDKWSVLTTTPEYLAYMYDTGNESFINSNDQRALHWATMAMHSNLYITKKFAKPTNFEDISNSYRLFFQPLMRKSEVYLIAAEVFQDPSYVDALRLNRGLKKLGETDDLVGYDLQEQICKEYMKEFVSEGQLFYYYKRRAETKIWGNFMVNGQPVVQMIDISNPGVSFVPPMPIKETQI